MVFTRNSAKTPQISSSAISLDTDRSPELVTSHTGECADFFTIDSIHKPSGLNQNDHSSIKKTQTVEDLERELFDSDDSSDDDDFSFAKKTHVQSADASELNSMFVIDRAADSGETIESAPQSSRTNVREDSGKDKETLIKELSKTPTTIHVDQTTADGRTSEALAGTSAHDEIMKKAVISADFEKRHSVPTYSEGKKAMARKRREEKATTKSEWFDMKAPEMTEELEADLQAIQMRGSTASWTGYKKNDYKNGPRFFQIATVQDSPLDFYHSRVAKKDRKRTIVDELLSDADFRRNNKKMYMKAVEKLNKRHPNKKGGRYGAKSKR